MIILVELDVCWRHINFHHSGGQLDYVFLSCWLHISIGLFLFCWSGQSCNKARRAHGDLTRRYTLTITVVKLQRRTRPAYMALLYIVDSPTKVPPSAPKGRAAVGRWGRSGALLWAEQSRELRKTETKLKVKSCLWIRTPCTVCRWSAERFCWSLFG